MAYLSILKIRPLFSPILMTERKSSLFCAIILDLFIIKLFISQQIEIIGNNPAIIIKKEIIYLYRVYD